MLSKIKYIDLTEKLKNILAYNMLQFRPKVSEAFLLHTQVDNN